MSLLPRFTLAQECALEALLQRPIPEKLRTLTLDELREIEAAAPTLPAGTTRQYRTRQSILDKVRSELNSRGASHP